MKSICFPISGNESSNNINFALDIISSIKNYDVFVCLHTENKELQNSLKNYHIKYDIIGIEHQIFPKESFIKNFFISYISSPKIFSYLMEKKPNIVHTFDVGTSLMWNSASKMNGQKIVFSQASKWNYPYFVGTIIGSANKIISPSKYYSSSLPLTIKSKSTVLYPFINNEAGSFDLKNELKIDDNSSMIFAIASSNKARTISLGEKLNTLFGKKIYLVMNSKKPFELKDTDIEIVGYPHKSFPKGADAFIVYDEEDNIYNEIRTAFHNSVPVFAVRNSMSIELIEDGENGFLVNSEDPKIIANKIFELWDLREQMTSIATQQPLMSLKEYIKNLEKIYEDL